MSEKFDQEVGKEQALANAQLVRKAPEILKALEEAVKDLCDYCPADLTKKEKNTCNLCNRIVKWKKLIAKCKKLISKAKGEK